jgi:NADH-quinone oxidoreductase subunit N
MTFTAPVLNYSLLAPILIVLGGALVGVLIEAFASRKVRPQAQLFVALATILASLATLISVRTESSATVAMSSVTFDGAGMIMQGTVLIIALISLFLIADNESFAPSAAALPGSVEERESIQAEAKTTEVFPLTLFAVAGMMLFPVASDLITLFVALEVLSLPLYLMSGLSRRRRLLSQEAALKYFLLGAFSSAFFLFGVSFIYGYSSSITYKGIQSAVINGGGNDVFLLLGIALISVGLLFKVGAVPFHAWSPDVYQGAPTPITAFMAAATKVAAFGAILRIYYVSFANAVWSWRPALVIIAIVTMLFGSVVAITQRDVKRMMAYSSIAHAGFLLSGVIALNKAGLDASLFYLLAYGIATVGGFAVISLIRDSAGEVTDLERWSGLGKRSPLIASVFAFFLLAFAGIPLTSGFIGKFSIFSAAFESGSTAILISGVIASAIAAFFYIRVIVLMFFKDPVEDGTSVVIPSAFTATTVAVAALVTLVLGVFPAPVVNFISNAAYFLR